MNVKGMLAELEVDAAGMGDGAAGGGDAGGVEAVAADTGAETGASAETPWSGPSQSEWEQISQIGEYLPMFEHLANALQAGGLGDDAGDDGFGDGLGFDLDPLADPADFQANLAQMMQASVQEAVQQALGPVLPFVQQQMSERGEQAVNAAISEVEKDLAVEQELGRGFEADERRMVHTLAESLLPQTRNQWQPNGDPQKALRAAGEQIKTMLARARAEGRDAYLSEMKRASELPEGRSAFGGGSGFEDAGPAVDELAVARRFSARGGA